MKLIIDIPNNLYETINNDKYGVHEGRIYDIIRNGTPLDDVKQEIWVTDFDFGDYYDHTDEIQDKVIEILDNIGKAESED